MTLEKNNKLAVLFAVGATTPLWMPILYNVTLELWCVAYGIGMQLGLL